MIYYYILFQANFPPGVINIVPGLGKIAGSAIALHSDIDKVSLNNVNFFFVFLIALSRQMAYSISR